MMRTGHSKPTTEPIEILPAPDLYVVEFEFPQHHGISVILAATCGLAAKAMAWSLFPEYERRATRTTVHHVAYTEIDWETGRTIVVKRRKKREVPASHSDKDSQGYFNDWRFEEGGKS